MFGTIINLITKPLEDAIEVFEGLTEGEIRTKAAIRLGTDIVAGMALSEVIEVMEESL